jgi:hypothetical protein
VALGQFYFRENGTGTVLFWREWHWDRLIVDWVALGQIYIGHSGIGTG